MMIAAGERARREIALGLSGAQLFGGAGDLAKLIWNREGSHRGRQIFMDNSGTAIFFSENRLFCDLTKIILSQIEGAPHRI